METVVAALGSQEGRIEPNLSGSRIESLKQDSSPVVYKLVRVDFDGRLVPATDDELMEVEDFLDYEDNEMFSGADDVQTTIFESNEVDCCNKSLSDEHEGLLQPRDIQAGEKQLNPPIECVGEMLLRVKEEEGHGLTSGSLSCSSAVNNQKQSGEQHDMSVTGRKLLSKVSELEILPMSSSIFHDRHALLCGDFVDCSKKAPDEATESRSQPSTVSTGFKPEFSLLKGEINMENLSIRELQEAFRATFGRETSVKDKQWLKRRISMGLTNSCDVPMTGFIIKDNKLVKKDEDASSNMVDAEDLSAGASSDTSRDVMVECDDEMEDTIDDLKFGNLLFTDCYSKEINLLEQRATKRVRKPTKRYIEESDMETQENVGREISSAKRSFTKPLVQPTWAVQSSSVSMRPDSFGGSGVQVPYVSRIRRCRPRRSIVSLTKFQKNRMNLEAHLVQNADEVVKSHFSGQMEVAEDTSVPCEELLIDENNDKQHSEGSPSELVEEQDLPLNSLSSTGTENNIACELTAKGGVRRKHHRAWSLTEVVKLVDGVSRYGPGRWSEIKRVAFASYSYRTSVDLKDKWRNLLKASFATASSEKGAIPRKPGSMPIPSPILLKVRELARLNGQVPRNIQVGNSISVNEIR